MFVIYNLLVNVWVSGLVKDGERVKVKYSVNREDAVRFGSREKAKKVYDHLPYIWKPHHAIMEYAESTQMHDRYFAMQDELYKNKCACDRK